MFVVNVLLHALEIGDKLSFDIAFDNVPNEAGEGNIYGTVAAMLIGLVMLSSLEPVRRKCWEIFVVLHMAWLPIVVLVCLHAKDLQYVVLLSVVLYGVDIIVRMYQSIHARPICSIVPIGGGAVRLEVRLLRKYEVINVAYFSWS